MWTMGFLLYVLMFNENPFYDVQETLTCQLQPPFAVSPLCLEVIKKLLCKDPEIRMKLDQLKEHPWLNQLVCIEEYKFSEIVPCSKYDIYIFLVPSILRGLLILLSSFFLRLFTKFMSF